MVIKMGKKGSRRDNSVILGQVSITDILNMTIGVEKYMQATFQRGLAYRIALADLKVTDGVFSGDGYQVVLMGRRN